MAQVQGQGYGFRLTAAQAGQKVDMATDIVDSFAAEGAIPYGRGVIRGTADNQCTLADDATEEFLGVSLFTHANEQALAGGAQYADKDAVSVLSFGRVWMDVIDTFEAGAPAYIIVTAGANRGKATVDDSGTLGPVGRFLSSGDGELGMVEITAALRGPQGPQGIQGPTGGA
jgi:hypothetical protein